MEIDNLPIQVVLEGDDLAALLDLGGTASSPSLRDELGKANGFSKSGLEQIATTGMIDRTKGKLTGTGQTLADVLLSPGSILSLEYRDMNGYAGRITVQFPGVPIAGSGIVVNKSNGLYHISAFADAETMMALVESVPPLISPDGFPSFETVMTMEQAAVYCVILDALARQFEEDERRQTAELAKPANSVSLAENTISAHRINEHLSIWWGTSSPNGLLSQVFALAITPEPPEPGKVAEILEEFVSAGLLERSTDCFRPVGVTPKLARATADIEAGFLWEHVHINHGGERPPEGVVKRYLVGGKGISFSFNLIGEAMLKFCTETPKDIAAFVARELTGRPDDPVMVSSMEEAESETNSSQRFCEQCGYRLTESPNFCEHCGHAITVANQADSS